MKKYYDINKLVFFLIGFFNLIMVNVHSQQFIFEVSPGLKLYGLSFQNIKSDINDGGGIRYSFENINKISSYNNINIAYKFRVEPELNVAFFRLNDKWKLSIGLSTYIVNSILTAKSSGHVYLPNADSSIIYNEHISKSLINSYNQFLFIGTRTFNTKIDEKLKNSISIGFGLNSPSRFNTRNEKQFYGSYLFNHNGYEKDVTFKKSSFFGLLTPIFIFKYELEIQNRKNDFGLFKLNFSYIQGFSNHNTFTLRSNSNDGSNMTIESVNRGSGFRIGISKTFKYTIEH
jgi:hypothetical protein